MCSSQLRTGVLSSLFVACLLLCTAVRASDHQPDHRQRADGSGAAEVLQLPSVEEQEGQDTGKPRLKLGEKVALDYLGPTIVNEDGTLRRITNWETLTEAERAATLKRIAERNNARLKLLRELKAEQELEKARESRVAQALHGDDTGASPAAQALLLSKQEEGEGGKGGDKQQEAGSETGEEAGIGDSLPGSPGSGELLQGVEQGFEEWSAEAGLDSVASGLGSSGANSTGAAGSGPEHSEL